MSYCHHYCLRRSTQWNFFKDVYQLSKLDVSSFSVTGGIVFKLVILLTLSSSKLVFTLLILGKSELTLFVPFYYFGQVIVILLNLGKTRYKKQSNKNSRTMHRICHNLFSMIQSAGIKNWCLQSINRL